MPNQATGRAREADIVSRLARFFPEATPVRIPIKLSRTPAMATVVSAPAKTKASFFKTRSSSSARRTKFCSWSTVLWNLPTSPGRKQRRLAARRSLRGCGSISPGTDGGCRPLPQTCSQLDCEIMTVSAEPPFQPSPEPSLEDQGATLRALQPIYSALVREFVIETAPCPINDMMTRASSISPESVENAAAWFEQVDAQDSGAPVAPVSADHAPGQRSRASPSSPASPAEDREVRRRPRQNGLPPGPVFFAVRALGPGRRRRRPRVRRSGARTSARVATAGDSPRG